MVATPYGMLEIHAYQNWIAMRFHEPEKVNEAVGLKGPHPAHMATLCGGTYNSYSGKWNILFATKKARLEEMERRLEWARSGKLFK